MSIPTSPPGYQKGMMYGGTGPPTPWGAAMHTVEEFLGVSTNSENIPTPQRTQPFEKYSLH